MWFSGEVLWGERQVARVKLPDLRSVVHLLWGVLCQHVSASCFGKTPGGPDSGLPLGRDRFFFFFLRYSMSRANARDMEFPFFVLFSSRVKSSITFVII